MDVLGDLVAKSLVQVESTGRTPRYRLLETIRQYGLERLEAAGEVAGVRRRQAGHFLTLAERAGAGPAAGGGRGLARPPGRRPRQPAGGARLGRAGGRRGRRGRRGRPAAPTGRGVVDVLVAAGALRRGAALARVRAAAAGRPAARIEALFGAASLSAYQDDIARAQTLWEELLALGRATGDEVTEAWALGRLGYVAHIAGDYERAAPLCAASVALSRRLGDGESLALALMSTGHLAYARADFAGAAARTRKAWRSTGRRGRPTACSTGWRCWERSPPSAATSTAPRRARRGGPRPRPAARRSAGSEQSLRSLLRVARRSGDHERATALIREHLATSTPTTGLRAST